MPTEGISKLTKLQLNKSPCANGNLINERLPYDALQRDYTFYGQSNYQYCQKDVHELFKKRPSCIIGSDACSFKNSFIPDVKSNKFLVRIFLKKS